jgi:hypothetical protein
MSRPTNGATINEVETSRLRHCAVGVVNVRVRRAANVNPELTR